MDYCLTIAQRARQKPISSVEECELGISNVDDGGDLTSNLQKAPSNVRTMEKPASDNPSRSADKEVGESNDNCEGGGDRAAGEEEREGKKIIHCQILTNICYRNSCRGKWRDQIKPKRVNLS